MLNLFEGKLKGICFYLEIFSFFIYAIQDEHHSASIFYYRYHNADF